MLLNDIFQSVPDLCTLLVHHLFRGFDVVGYSVIHEFFHNKRAEQLDRHFLRDTALVDLQIRPDNDNRTAGVVNTLTKQILAETALLAFQHIRK